MTHHLFDFFFQIKTNTYIMYSPKNLNFVSLDLPITIGTIPFDNATTSASTSHLRTRTVASAPPLDIWPYSPRPMEPSAPAFPDDDTVSIRTYASTPPPFPDDGECLFSFTLSSISYVESFLFTFSTKISIFQRTKKLCWWMKISTSICIALNSRLLNYTSNRTNNKRTSK